MTTVKYTLDELVYDMEGLVASQPDYQKIFDTGSAWLERLTPPQGDPRGQRLRLERRGEDHSGGGERGRRRDLAGDSVGRAPGPVDVGPLVLPVGRQQGRQILRHVPGHRRSGPGPVARAPI